MTKFLYILLFTFSSNEPIKIIQDVRVDALLLKHIEYNKSFSVNGFRINIYSQSGNHSHSSAIAAQAQFSELFPDIKSYVNFEEPYFKVKVGNFRTRIEAVAALGQLQTHYPQAYVVRDVLNLQDLLKIEPPTAVLDSCENF